MSEFNVTYDDKHYKFCLNIPLELKPDIDARSQELEFNSLKGYLMELVKVDLEYRLLKPPERYKPEVKKDTAFPWTKRTFTN